jgi:Tol biopolymer transport system component
MLWTSPALAAFPGANGRIVFGLGDLQGPMGTSVKAQPHEVLFASRVDGSELERLTHGDEFDATPAWSSDGTKVVYTAAQYYPQNGGSARGFLRVLDIRGRVQTLRRCTCSAPSWSPDGRHIVLEERFPIPQPPYGNMESDLVVMRADGTGARRLTHDLEGDRAPVWSPNGRDIAFERQSLGHAGERSVYTVRPDGTHMRRLTQGDGTDPAWSPDGRLIAFSGSHGHRVPQILAVNATGSRIFVLSHPSGMAEFAPIWSPDGRQIIYTGSPLFTGQPNYRPRLYVQRVASRSSRRCLRLNPGSPQALRIPSDAVAPDWQPTRTAHHHPLRPC